MEMLRLSGAPPLAPGASPSLFQRFTGIFSSPTSGAPEGAAASAEGSVKSRKPQSKSKRTYGFASSQLAQHSDRGSEDLYRYKNFSSEQMRSTSPTRDEAPAPIIRLSLIEDKEDEPDTKTEENEPKPILPTKPDDEPKA